MENRVLGQKIGTLRKSKNLTSEKLNRLTPNELSMLDGFLETYFCKLESIKK